jgi:hypothetical protein
LNVFPLALAISLVERNWKPATPCGRLPLVLGLGDEEGCREMERMRGRRLKVVP